MFLFQGTYTHSLTAPIHSLAHSFSSPSQLLCVTPTQAAVHANSSTADQDMKFEPEGKARTQSSLLDIAHAIEDQKAAEELHESLQISHTALLSSEDTTKQSCLSEAAHAIVHKLSTE